MPATRQAPRTNVAFAQGAIVLLSSTPPGPVGSAQACADSYASRISLDTRPRLLTS